MGGCGKCCFNFLRIIVILLNLLFVLIGCAILGIAIFLYVDKTFKGMKENMPDKRLMVDILLFSAIGIGGITIIVSTFGCCGAYHESECLLGTYFFCLFVIVAAEVAAVVVAYLKLEEKEVKDIITQAMKSSIKTYMSPGEAKLPEHIRLIQDKLDCCGSENPGDYLLTAGTDISTSFSTLSNPDRKKWWDACAAQVTFIKWEISEPILKGRPGCTDKIYNFLNENKLWVLIISICIATIELGAMIFAICLCCSVRRMESGYIGVST